LQNGASGNFICLPEDRQASYSKSDFTGSSREHFQIANDSGFCPPGTGPNSEAAFARSGLGEIALDLATIL
jgi:hypothetical protein